MDNFDYSGSHLRSIAERIQDLASNLFPRHAAVITEAVEALNVCADRQDKVSGRRRAIRLRDRHGKVVAESSTPAKP
jgi:hypothetical protein